VFPEQTSANNANKCFNWFQTSDATRGQGEALSVKQMVDYAVTHYGSDPHRVYVTGLSAGGAMTAVMLATYPDVFTGGAIVAGIPYRCATDLTSGLSCQTGATSKSPAQRGDLVRAADSGYHGPWPRVAVWYGTSDSVVNTANATQSRDQWTNVWGIGQTPSATSTLPGGTTMEAYDDAGGNPVVELYKVQGIGHGTPVAPGSAENQCGATGAYFPQSICSRPPVTGERVRQRIQPGDGAVERVHHAHPAPYRYQLLRHRRRPVLSEPAASTSAAANRCGYSMCGECPHDSKTISWYRPPAAAYRSRTARVCVTIGCGGHSSAPGQPGTAPRLPRYARSNSEVSETMTSESPRIQVTGGLPGRSTIPVRSSQRGDMVLSTPRVPGPTMGQLSEATESPG